MATNAIALSRGISGDNRVFFAQFSNENNAFKCPKNLDKKLEKRNQQLSDKISRPIFGTMGVTTIINALQDPTNKSPEVAKARAKLVTEYQNLKISPIMQKINGGLKYLYGDVDPSLTKETIQLLGSDDFFQSVKKLPSFIKIVADLFPDVVDKCREQGEIDKNKLIAVVKTFTLSQVQKVLDKVFKDPITEEPLRDPVYILPMSPHPVSQSTAISVNSNRNPRHPFLGVPVTGFMRAVDIELQQAKVRCMVVQELLKMTDYVEFLGKLKEYVELLKDAKDIDNATKEKMLKNFQKYMSDLKVCIEKHGDLKPFQERTQDVLEIIILEERVNGRNLLRVYLGQLEVDSSIQKILESTYLEQKDNSKQVAIKYDRKDVQLKIQKIGEWRAGIMTSLVTKYSDFLDGTIVDVCKKFLCVTEVSVTA